MVKTQATVKSWKPLTIKVETGHIIEVSTAYESAPKATYFLVPRVVRAVNKAVLIENKHHINLTNVNRTLRGRRDPVMGATGELQERETA